MSETKLLPCPFCGGEAILHHNGLTEKDHVVCCVCGCRQEASNTEDDASKKWNTRKQIERILARLEYLKVNTFDDESVIIDDVIEIIKEEGRLND